MKHRRIPQNWSKNCLDNCSKRPKIVELPFDSTDNSCGYLRKSILNNQWLKNSMQKLPTHRYDINKGTQRPPQWLHLQPRFNKDHLKEEYWRIPQQNLESQSKKTQRQPHASIDINSWREFTLRGRLKMPQWPEIFSDSRRRDFLHAFTGNLSKKSQSLCTFRTWQSIIGTTGETLEIRKEIPSKLVTTRLERSKWIEKIG